MRPDNPVQADNNAARSHDSSVSSVLIIEDETQYPILLKYTVSKNMFLTKVSFYFMLYMVFLALVCILIFENLDLAKMLYRLWYLNYTDVFIFIDILVIKLGFMLLGNTIRHIAVYLFVADVFLSMLATLALYFRMENFVQLPYVYTGHYLIIYITCIATSAIAFFLTTIFRDGTNIYSVPKGVFFMSTLNLVPIYIFETYWEEVLMSPSRYNLIWLSLVVFNWYIARNSWLLVNARTEKFYDHEYIYAFECYFTDFLFRFWVDSKEEFPSKNNVSVTQDQSYTNESISQPSGGHPANNPVAQNSHHDSLSQHPSELGHEVEPSAEQAA